MATFLRIRPQSTRGLLLRLSFSPRVSFSRSKILTTATSVPRSGQRLKSYNNGSETSRYHGNSRDISDQNGSDGGRSSLLLQGQWILEKSAAQNGIQPRSPDVPHPIQKNDYYAIWSLFSKQKDGFLRHNTKADKVSFDGHFGPAHFPTIGFQPKLAPFQDTDRVVFHLFAVTKDENKVILTRDQDTNHLVTEVYNEEKHRNDEGCQFEPEYFWSYTLFKNVYNSIARYIASDAAGNATLVRQLGGSGYPFPRTLFLLTGIHIETG